jgi:hypothetical protein
MGKGRGKEEDARAHPHKLVSYINQHRTCQSRLDLIQYSPKKLGDWKGQNKRGGMEKKRLKGARRGNMFRHGFSEEETHP